MDDREKFIAAPAEAPSLARMAAGRIMHIPVMASEMQFLPSRRVLWMRHGWENDENRQAEAVAWCRANDLDPDHVSGEEPFVIGRPSFPRLTDGPTITTVLVFDDPARYEPHPSDEGVQVDPDGPVRVRRTVPLKVPPPPGMLLDVAGEIQRAMDGDPAMREWVEDCLRRSPQQAGEVHNG